MKYISIQRAFTATACGLIFTITFLFVTQPVRAQSKIFSLSEAQSIAQGNDLFKMRELAYSEAPNNLSYFAKNTHYRYMKDAAIKIADGIQLEKILRDWLASTNAQEARSVLFNTLFRGTSTQLEEAVTLGERSVAAVTYPSQKVNTRTNLAELYLSLGEYGKAEALLKEAEAVVKNGLSSINAHNAAMARAYYLRARCIQNEIYYNYQRAEELCLQALGAFSDAINNKNLVDASLHAYPSLQWVLTASDLARIYTQTSRYYDAQVVLQKAQTISATISHSKGTEQIGIFGALSRLALAQKDRQAFEQLNQQSAVLLRQAYGEKTTTARIKEINSRIQAWVIFEEWAKAEQVIHELDLGLTADPNMKRLALNLIPRSLIYLMNNRAAQAVLLLTPEIQKSSNYLGADHPQTALLRGLLALSQAAVNPANEATALSELDRSVVVLSSGSARAGDYFNQIDHPIALQMILEKYIELASKNGDPRYTGRALGIADSLRSSGVQSAMNDAAVRASAGTPTLAELVRRDQDSKNELASLYNFISNRAGEVEAKRLEGVIGQMKTRITELEKSRNELKISITKQFPEYSKLTNPAPPTLEDIGAKLKVDEALLTLLPTDTAVYVWAVTNSTDGQTKQQFTKVNMDKAELAKLVKRLRASLDVAGIPDNRRPVFDHAAAQELYAKLLSPVQQGLAGKTSLIVAAGGVLGQIPFGVLQTADKDSWLIKQAAITHVPSVAAWLSMRSLPHQTASQPMLAWGDPLFNIALASNTSAKGEVRKVVLTRANTAVDLEKEDPRSALKYANISPLPETRDELTAIAKTLGADAAKDLILGSAATRESVLTQNKNGELAKRRVVAFATHGLMAGDLPNLTQPALAMAGTKDDSTNVLAPLLTLEDVLTLKLNADWVVLSACNTAAADGKAEEALSGLARGFFYAGSRSLLVTHWAVDSESAVTLTTETFKNYQSKPQEAKAESLRQAMLTVMSNPATAHPTFWAPYALVGDGAR